MKWNDFCQAVSQVCPESSVILHERITHPERIVERADAASILLGAFAWSHTKEGHKHWHRVFKELGGAW